MRAAGALDAETKMVAEIETMPEMVVSVLVESDIDPSAHFCEREPGCWVIDGEFDIKLAARLLPQKLNKPAA